MNLHSWVTLVLYSLLAPAIRARSCHQGQLIATPLYRRVQGRVEVERRELGEWRPTSHGIPLSLSVELSDALSVSRACEHHPFCFFEQPSYVARLSNHFYDDTCESDNWQKQVYLYAREVANHTGVTSVADVGTGSGFKLIRYFGDLPLTIGLDLKPTVSWLRKRYPSRLWLESSLERDFRPPQVDLVIASDVIEHIPNAHSKCSRSRYIRRCFI